MKRAQKIRWALWPLRLPYGIATCLRSAAYDHRLLRPRRLGGVVISVGNLTTGGTGKTPLVELIAGRLASEGRRVGILTRGYRGATGPDGTRTSDEVQLLETHLEERVAFGVGADRYVRGCELENRGIEWFVLDDGFQHRQLARDANILVIDASAPFGGGHLLPVGDLREPRSAMARADIVVITRSESSPAIEAEIRRYSEAPIFYAHTELDSIVRLGEGGRGEGASRTRAKWFAFCGIGNPEAFLEDLGRWNFDVVGHNFFRDHHRYTPRDVARIEAEARASGASELICTEKDAFNLQGMPRAQYRPLYARILMKIDGFDEFWSALLAAIVRRQQGPGVW
jgi:tetraacyldisaccharide 4'-kinase